MQSTLLLDQSYMPLDIIKWTEAISLFFLGKCEIIEEYEEEIHSTYLVIKMPAVVRLIKSFRHKKKKVKFSRLSIYARDGFQCLYCGCKGKIKDLTFDHIVPRSRGGKTTWINIATSCVPCNLEKANRTPTEAKMKLIKIPEEPKWLPVVMIKLSERSAPEAWRDYLYWNGKLDQDT